MGGWPKVKLARPRYLEAFVGLRVPACAGRAWLAVPARVGPGDGETDFFEFGDRFAEPFVVVEPGTVVGEL